MSYIVDLRKQRKVAEPPKQQPKQPKEVLSVSSFAKASADKKEEPEIKKEPEITTVKPPSLSHSEASVSQRPFRFQWEAPSFHYNPQKKYLAIVIIALIGGAGTLLFYGWDMFLAIFLMLSSLVLILYANKKPGILQVGVDQIGVSIDDRIYYYRELKSFWIDYSPHGPKELSLETRKWYLPHIKVSIEKEDPLKLRSLMVNFVPERVHEPSLIDFIGRKIGL